MVHVLINTIKAKNALGFLMNHIDKLTVLFLTLAIGPDLVWEGGNNSMLFK